MNYENSGMVTDDQFVVGLFGRIKQSTGQYLFIEAICQLRHKHENIRALIVGHRTEQSYLDKLKQDVATAGISKQVIFTGFTDRVGD